MRLAILPGLPPYGDPARSFTATGRGTHAQGLVVGFTAETGASWTGNFVPGLGKLDLVLPHPDAKNALIIARGQAYVVDPVSGTLVGTFGGFLNNWWRHPDGASLVFESAGIEFEAHGAAGLLWRSRRVSWDGFRNLRLQASALLGESWCFDETWHPFELQLASGSVSGGSYHVPSDAST